MIDGMRANIDQINHHVERSLMLVTALSPSIGYEKASQIAHHALEHNMTLKQAALFLKHVSAEDFDRIVDPGKMVAPVPAGQLDVAP